jgi:hypothetical protein
MNRFFLVTSIITNPLGMKPPLFRCSAHTYTHHRETLDPGVLLLVCLVCGGREWMGVSTPPKRGLKPKRNEELS